ASACSFGLGAGRKRSKINAVPHGGNEGRTDAGTDEAAVARAAARAPRPGHRDSPDRRRPLPRSARPHPHEASQASPQRPDLLDRETARSRYPRLRNSTFQPSPRAISDAPLASSRTPTARITISREIT